MANYCEFDMKVVGDKASLDEFIRRGFEQKGFHRVYNWDMDSFKEGETYIYGGCKWNVSYAMDNPEDSGNEHISSLSEELGLKIEVWSSESGCAFQEHIRYDKGKCICNESKKWQVFDVLFEAEEYMPDYRTPKTAEEENQIVNWYNKRHSLQLNPNDLDEAGCISISGFSNYRPYSI